MIAGVYSSLSAFQAFGRKLEVTANNIANLDTDGFKKSRVEMIEAAPGQGVQAVVQPVPTPGVQILEDRPQGPQLVEQSNVDLGEELVNLMVAQRGFELNAAALRAQDEALGTLLNLIE